MWHENAPEHAARGRFYHSGVGMDIITEIDFGTIGKVLKAHGRRPKLTDKGWLHMCVCGNHAHDDKELSARAWTDARGRLGVVCWADAGDSTAARRNLMEMLRGSYRGPGSEPRFKRPTRHSKDDNETRRAQAQSAWRDAIPMPEKHDAPPTLWLGEKAAFYGRAPGGIRWERKVGRDGMVGSIMGLLAPPSAWRDAYPNLPEPEAIQRVSINAAGRQVKGLKIKGGWLDKRSNGPMVGSVVIFGLSSQRGTVRVAEGIADAAAVRGRWQQETWATCGTSGFKNQSIAQELAQYDEVIIHSDAGAAGEHAARILRDHIVKAGGYALVCPPASGSDPADARGEVAGAADAAPGTAMGVKWGDVSPDLAAKAIGENEFDHSNTVTKSVFPLPARPMELWCDAPFTIESNLPKGEKHTGPGDCGACVPCLEWWRLKSKERIRHARGVQSVLNVRMDSMSEAAKWRGKLARHLAGQTVRLLTLDRETVAIDDDIEQPTLLADDGAVDEGKTVVERDIGVVTFLICYDPTVEEIAATEEALVDKGIHYTWNTAPLSVDDLDDILPWCKTIADENGEEHHSISTARSMPTLGKIKERSRYMLGDPEYVNEYVNRDTLEPLPAEYERREEMPIPGQGDMLNAADRMARPTFDLSTDAFLDVVDMIAEDAITNADDLKKPLMRCCSEYGGSRLLIYDTAEWRAGRGKFRPAYGPVLERLGLLSRRELANLGVEAHPCKTCGSRYCDC